MSANKLAAENFSEWDESTGVSPEEENVYQPMDPFIEIVDRDDPSVVLGYEMLNPDIYDVMDCEAQDPEEVLCSLNDIEVIDNPFQQPIEQELADNDEDIEKTEYEMSAEEIVRSIRYGGIR